MFPIRFEMKAAVWSASVTALCIVAVSFLGASMLPRRATIAQSEPSVDRTSDDRGAVASPVLLACEDSQQALTIATAAAMFAAAAALALSAQLGPYGRPGHRGPWPSPGPRIRPSAIICRAQRRKRAIGGNHLL
jgi:hypothetical protein